MLDIALEVARSLVMSVIFAYVVVAGRKHGLPGQRGWRLIVAGFGLILLGSLLDITDNFDSLNRFVVVGDTPVEAVLEKVVGYLAGFVLVFAGLWHWVPLVGGIEGEKRRLGEYAEELEAEVARRTADLERANDAIRQELAERERAQQAVREAENRFRQFATLSSDWFWEMGPDLRFSYFSEGYQEKTRLSASDLIGKTRWELAGGRDDAEKWTEHRSDLEARRPFRNFTYEVRVDPDEIAHRSVSGFPIFDGEGEFRGYRGTATDVTERVRAEEALKEREARAAAIVEGAFDGIITIDEHGVVETFNPGAQRCFGYEPEEVIGRNVTTLMPEPYRSEHHRYIRNFLETGQAKIIGIGREVEGRRKDGAVFPMELAVTQMRVSGTRMFTGIVRDISERKKADRVKSEFISMVSHELRTPLTSIQGALGLINGGQTGELPEKARAMLEIAHNNSNRLVRLVNDILDIEKIEAGKIHLSLRPLKLAPLLGQAIDANKGFADRLRVAFTLRTGLPDVMVKADAERLMQVLTNLLSNAAKFSPAGQEVSVSAALENDTVRVSVTDLGPGIPEEFRARIFEKFAQADSSDRRRTGGTGLGLSISKAIVEQHDGSIGFDTETGKGTTFYFDLPVCREETAAAPVVGRQPREGESSKPRILVCEDDRDIAKLLRLLLEQKGFECDVVYDASQAKERLATTDYAAMTLDLCLPDEDGISLIRELRENEATTELPIIVVCARANAGSDELNGNVINVVDWLEKPIDEQRLDKALRRAVRRSSARKPHILHVEDDSDLLTVVSALLDDLATVATAGTQKEARQLLEQQDFDLVILDLILPDGRGEDLLPLIHPSGKPAIPVIVFSVREISRSYAGEVEAALIKSRVSSGELFATIRSILDEYYKMDKVTQPV